jgi:Kef-type K+ transport system membrane component KefB
MLIVFKAFPVLCRILTELKLLSTPVGIITLASSVGDDVVGWVCKFCVYPVYAIGCLSPISAFT